VGAHVVVEEPGEGKRWPFLAGKKGREDGEKRRGKSSSAGSFNDSIYQGLGSVARRGYRFKSLTRTTGGLLRLGRKGGEEKSTKKEGKER